jgi:matrix metalloproteinase-14 (membrane-inserted)
MDDQAVLQFLKSFGYLPADATAVTTESIVAAQVAYGLTPTGVVDEMTTRLWQRTPRCGFTDAQAVGFNKWGLKTVSWFVAASPVGLGLTKADYLSCVKQAFDSWSAVCGLKFEQSDEANANIVLSTGRGRRAGFDGPSGTLAYAYLPQGENFRGRLELYMDLDEAWTLDEERNGILTVNVLAHEIGHTLGLDHSNTRSQLMNPTYNARIAKPQAEDAKRVVDRYGKPASVPTPPVDPPPGDMLEVQVRVGGTKVYAGTIPARA